MRPPPPTEMTCGFLIQLVFCKKNYVFIGVEVEQETSAPSLKKDPGSAPGISNTTTHLSTHVQPSVTSHAEDTIILPECNHEQEFSKPLNMQLIPTVLRLEDATILLQNKQQKQQKLIDIYFMINCSDEFLLKDTQPFISSVALKKQD